MLLIGTSFTIRRYLKRVPCTVVVADRECVTTVVFTRLRAGNGLRPYDEGCDEGFGDAGCDGEGYVEGCTAKVRRSSR